MQGQADPRSVVDVLWVMVGVMSDGGPMTLEPPTMRTNYMLEGRSSRVLKAEVVTTAALLETMNEAGTSDDVQKLKAAEIRDELQSILTDVDGSTRATVTQSLSLDLQRLVDYVVRIEEAGDARAFDDSGLGRKLDAGKQRPRSTLEFYRFIYGFYAARL